MDPITQAFIQGAAGASGDKTYVDEVFNTKTYRGNATERSITTGLDIAGEGGLIWFKNRDLSNQSHRLVDTTALPDSSSPWYSYILQTNSTAARGATANGFKSFNSDGFTIQTDNSINGNNDKQVAWSFRKAPGFFDIVSYTGDGVAGRTVAHNLGCVPGMVIIKKTSNSGFWAVGHDALDWTAGDYLRLNTNNAVASHIVMWNDTAPTSTHVTLGTSSTLNTDGQEYVMYLFAGGSTLNTTDKAVDFDGTGDYLMQPANTDLELDGDFTIEGWVNVDVNGWGGVRQTFFANSIGWTTNHAGISLMNSGSSDEQNCITVWSDQTRVATSSPVTVTPSDGWTHIAVTRSGSSVKIFKNGAQAGSTATYSDTFHFGTGATWVGAITMSTGATPEVFDGEISNLRVVKGQALYKTNFNVPSEPLTTTSQGAYAPNVKLLCCNQATTTGSTVTPGTISANGDPTVTTNNSIFYDSTLANVFGEGRDQSIVNCGYYTGNGASLGPETHLGFEPQWVMVKRVDADADWLVWDIMRGIVTGGSTSDPMLYPNEEYAESTTIYRMDLTSRGFKITSSNGAINANGGKYIYMAIRRPDPLVGKPALVGTDVFAIDNDTNANPDFRSNFPVDFAFAKNAATSSGWWTSARLAQSNRLYINEQSAEAAGSTWCDFDWGDPDGWSTGNFNTDVYSWMFKRHAGFDVVAYRGDGASGGQYLPHNLNAVPEMIWCKSRSQSSSYWGVYHIGLNAGSGSGAESKRLDLHDNGAEVNSSFWNHTAPTSEMFSVGNTWTQSEGDQYIAMLFASVPGISKVGYYTGSSGSVTINLGFTPKFLIFKNIDATANWAVFDTMRGITDAWSPVLNFNNTNVQAAFDKLNTTTNGIIVENGSNYVNLDGNHYIYYAHA